MELRRSEVRWGTIRSGGGWCMAGTTGLPAPWFSGGMVNAILPAKDVRLRDTEVHTDSRCCFAILAKRHHCHYYEQYWKSKLWMFVLLHLSQN